MGWALVPGFLLIASLLPVLGAAEATQGPITMEQLMRELRVVGGNFDFRFDQPVYARVRIDIAQYPEGPVETTCFDTDGALRRIELFFTASPMFLGDHLRGDAVNDQKLMVKLSGCRETDGTRILYYRDKFAESRYRNAMEINEWRPAIPPVPELDKEYVLYWYFRKGDPYQAKATIAFSAGPWPKK